MHTHTHPRVPPTPLFSNGFAGPTPKGTPSAENQLTINIQRQKVVLKSTPNTKRFIQRQKAEADFLALDVTCNAKRPKAERDAKAKKKSDKHR